ncbi:MAG: sulfite exporter TauE/SafE family protein [Cellulosilyticaceae bacterium]
MLLVLIIANLIVGILVGIAGIAGFLLPITYAGILNLPVNLSLALSFTSFLTSGLIGGYGYMRKQQVDLKLGIQLSIGSLLGAWLGVQLNLLIPAPLAKILLYIVVFLSGLSILIKQLRQKHQVDTPVSTRLHSLPFNFGLGLVTSTICALSGAGGPILVMPLLVSLGLPIRLAVGTSLFNSIFIALPACIGYISQCEVMTIWPLLLVSFITQAIGVTLGTIWSSSVNHTVLKYAVALFSMGIACYMIHTALPLLLL